MDDERVRKWVHDLNNRVGIVLAQSELLQMEQLSPKAMERTRVIEAKALELRQMIRELTEHLLG